jgi:hypothetical protein
LLGKPNHAEGQDHYESGGGDCRSADCETKNKWLSSAVLPLTGQARPQAQVKVSGRRDWLKAAHQLAQTYSLRTKSSTRRAYGDMRSGLIAQLLAQL